MLAIGPLFFVGGLFIGLGLAAGLGAIFIVGLVLNAVLGFSEIIRDEILGPVGNNAYRYYANDIQKSGACLLAVINDLLDVTKLESGSVVLEDRPENPHDIMEQAIKLTRNATGDERAVAFILPGMLPTLTVDPRRPAQAVGNLLANALKSTPVGGDVRLRLVPQQDGGVIQSVEDTGIGMAQETIAAALEPFCQLDGSLSRKFEGAGLGMSIAKVLTELHGRRLGIASEVGSGTIVTLWLPASRVAHYFARALSVRGGRR